MPATVAERRSVVRLIAGRLKQAAKGAVKLSRFLRPVYLY